MFFIYIYIWEELNRCLYDRLIGSWDDELHALGCEQVKNTMCILARAATPYHWMGMQEGHY